MATSTDSYIPVDDEAPGSGREEMTIPNNGDISSTNSTDPNVPEALVSFEINKLPVEVRCKIWQAAMSARIVAPVVRYECELSTDCHLKHRHRYSVLQPRAVSQVCRESRDVASGSVKRVANITHTTFQPDRLESLHEYDHDPWSINLNQATDTIYLDWLVIHQRLRLGGHVDTRQDILTVAADPAVSLIIDAEGFSGDSDSPSWIIRFVSRPKQLVDMLYRWYLKPRSHVFLLNQKRNLCLDIKEAARVINEEHLFLEAGESRIISLDDVETIGKYFGLCDAPLRDIHEALQSRRQYEPAVLAQEFDVSYATWFKLCIADDVLEQHGMGPGQGWQIVDWEGEVKTEHPLVTQLDFRLPKMTEVAVFELLPPLPPTPSSGSGSS